MWPDSDTAIRQVIDELREQQVFVTYSGGRWYTLDVTTNLTEPMTQDDAAALDRRVNELKRADILATARQRVAQRTGYDLNRSGSWMTGQDMVAPTGALRRRGQYVTRQERESLERQAESMAANMTIAPPPEDVSAGPDTEDDGRTFGTADVARELNLRPETVRSHAQRIGVPRSAGGIYRFRRRDIEQIRESTGGGGGEDGERGERTGRGAAGAAGGGGGGGGMASLAGAITGAAGAVVGAGTTIAQGVAGLIGGALEMAATSGAGMTGAGAARITRGVINLFAQGITAAGSMALEIGGALLGVVARGLAVVGGVALFAVGGAVLGVIVGGIAAVATGLADAVGRAFGAVSQAAQEALNGVVMVLRDLTSTGKDFSQRGAVLRGLGGVSPGQDLSLQLFGQATGVDAASMFNTWGMRPEFAQARFGAMGVDFDPGDMTGSLIALTEQLRELPAMLQFPMAQAITGGHGETMMRLLMLPRERLDEARRLPGELGTDPQLLQRIFTRLEPALNRITTIFTGLKLDVLEATLPTIEAGVSMLSNLWNDNRTQVLAFINGIPQMLETGLQALLSGSATVVRWLANMYERARAGWDWLRSEVWPVLRDVLGGIASAFGWTGGGSTGSAPSGGGGGRAPAGGGPGSRASNFGETVGRGARWAVDNPLLALGAAILGPTVLQGGARAAMQPGAWRTAARFATSPAGRVALPVAGGILSGTVGTEIAMRGQGTGSLIGGALTAVGGGAAIGGAVGGPVGAVIGALAGFGTALYRVHQLNKQMDEIAEEAGQPAQVARRRRSDDPVVRNLNAVADWLQKQSDELPNALRQAMTEAQKQQENRDLGTLKVQVAPSREFAAQMEWQQSLAMWRSVQLAVS